MVICISNYNKMLKIWIKIMHNIFYLLYQVSIFKLKLINFNEKLDWIE